MRYIPHTEQDVASMLRLIGAPSVESLFSHIPAALRPSAVVTNEEDESLI